MTTTVVPTVLSYKNYKDWSFRMKTYFLAEDLWDIVSGTVTKPPEGEEHKAWKKKDAKALYAIQNSCGDNTYKLIKGKTTAKEAWDTLVQKVRYGSVNLSDEDSSDEDSHDEANKPVCHVYPTPPDHDATLESAMEEALSTRGAGHDEIKETFVKYVKSNDWDNAINFLRQHPQAATATIPDWPYTTALHYAIKERCSVRIIQQLVELMDNEHLEITDLFGCTALDWLINDCPEWVEAAECIVKKNLNIVTSVPSNRVPLVLVAQGMAKGERLARFLYSLTPHEQLNVSQAAHLISLGFHLERLDLIHRYPKLAITKDLDKNIPLVTLASNGSAFKSGSRLNLWEKLIYHG
ncbi:unnamed protein product [Malus baccata var. baccata]